MKKFIAGIVMSALLFMALATGAMAGTANKWGNRFKDSVYSSSDGGAYDCAGGNASRYNYEAYCTP